MLSFIAFFYIVMISESTSSPRSIASDVDDDAKHIRFDMDCVCELVELVAVVVYMSK